jgi:hypothetical protein
MRSQPGWRPGTTLKLFDRLEASYRVATTAHKAGAGIDASMGVFLHERGVTGWTVDGTFEKGDTNVIHLGTHDVGPMTTVVLSRDSSGDDGPWLVTKITVQRKMTVDEWSWTSAAASGSATLRSSSR